MLNETSYIWLPIYVFCNKTAAGHLLVTVCLLSNIVLDIVTIVVGPGLTTTSSAVVGFVSWTPPSPPDSQYFRLYTVSLLMEQNLQHKIFFGFEVFWEFVLVTDSYEIFSK